MMKDFDALIIFFLVVVVAALLIMGVISAIKKSAQLIPETDRSQMSQTLRQQKERTRQIEEQRERTLRDNQQRYRDYKRRTGSF